MVSGGDLRRGGRRAGKSPGLVGGGRYWLKGGNSGRVTNSQGSLQEHCMDSGAKNLAIGRL